MDPCSSYWAASALTRALSPDIGNGLRADSCLPIRPTFLNSHVLSKQNHSNDRRAILRVTSPRIHMPGNLRIQGHQITPPSFSCSSVFSMTGGLGENPYDGRYRCPPQKDDLIMTES
jgi:hypothetical protein